ncbi:hypothetical protein RclHR1_00920028 [Rhizophagus clarus]|nr:hypothetical protein RclHR1_00920028 [Rhizophagus clarus]
MIPSIPPSALSSVSNLFQDNLVKKITISIDNTQSRNMLHHGKRIFGTGKLIKPLPVMISRGEMGFIESKSIIEKACGIVIYEIGDERMDNLPLLIVGWRVSLTGKNKWFASISYEPPDERFIKKYLKENGITGTNTLDFNEHMMTIYGSISDG